MLQVFSASTEEDSMYAVIRRYETSAGAIQGLVKRVSGQFADRIPGQVGSVLYTAIDTGHGTATTVTFFPDEESARRSAEAVGQVQRSLSEFGVVEKEVIQGEVLLSRANEAVVRSVDPE
jgi:hypothetical protein